MLGTAVDDSTSSDAGDVIVKIERKEAVTAWLSENKFTKRTYCARDLAKMRNCYEKLTSMEFYTARLVDSKPRFLRFFSDSSLPLISSAASIGISPKRSPQQQSNNVQVLENLTLTLLTFTLIIIIITKPNINKQKILRICYLKNIKKIFVHLKILILIICINNTAYKSLFLRNWQTKNKNRNKNLLYKLYTEFSILFPIPYDKIIFFCFG